MANRAKNCIRLHITTGDVRGIGFEVTAKALAQLGPQKNCQFFVWGSVDPKNSYLKLLAKKFKIVTHNENLDLTNESSKNLVLIKSKKAPVEWVIRAIQSCQSGEADGLVTGPLSKVGISESGYSYLGHTEILKDKFNVKRLFMGFMGDKCSVVLATGHVPISEVPKVLTLDLLKEVILRTNSARLNLSKKKAQLPMGILGLNPHAGEAGLIGTEESQVIEPAVRWAKAQGISIEGPLVPDAAFANKNYLKYSMMISPAHDLGLIPFKMLHGYNSGYHVTLGLPIVRTSVDHGTANDLFNKNKALAGSMKAAIQGAMELARESRSQI